MEFVAGLAIGFILPFVAVIGLLISGNKAIALRDRTITELIDKFVHNKVPERIVEQRQVENTTTKPRPTLDPVSAAEALAREAAEE